MSLLIKNGRIITATDDRVADVLCEGETIARIGPRLAAPRGAEVIDAAGKYVFPGFIDPHVHIHLPFMGTYAKDDYQTASAAAVVGGTTTLIEMICPGRDDDPLEAFDLWRSKAAEKSACDYSFHMGVTRFDQSTAAKLKRIVRAGVASFKIFLAYKGAFGIDDAELFQTLALAKKLGVIVTAHCENAELVARNQARLVAEAKKGPEWHEPSRPESVEADGVHHLTTFAELTGAHVYVVHTSCGPALRVAQAAIERGVHAWVETVIPYLVLDKTFAEQPRFEGAKYVMSPPLRHKRNQPILWDAIRTGLISTVATDHAPFDFKTQKTMGRPPRSDFTKIPNGIPSIEDRITLFYTYGVLGEHPPARHGGLSPRARPQIDLHTFVNCASTRAAKIFGLYPRKGDIRVGGDADLVVFDPKYRGKISVKTQYMNVDYSAFEGHPIKGRPSVVTVRGQVVARNGKFVGTPGRGEFLQREPTHG